MTVAPKIDTLIEDIQTLLVNGGRFDQKLYDELGVQVAAAVKERMERPLLILPENTQPNLRMSNVGKPDRQLWHMFNSAPGESVQEHLTPEQCFKFLYGSILEEVMLWLATQSGHSVTDRQKEVLIEGVPGHIDCRIDGVGVDAKSASGQSYKTKFKQGRILRGDDPFGYLPQLGGYFQGEPSAAFFVSNKETGELLLFKVPAEHLPDTAERIKYIRKMVAAPEPPPLCYDTKDIGKNKALRAGCKSCAFKSKCWDGLRAFVYADGVEYLTEVVTEPKVAEVSLDGKTIIKSEEEAEFPTGKEWFVAG